MKSSRDLRNLEGRGIVSRDERGNLVIDASKLPSTNPVPEVREVVEVKPETKVEEVSLPEGLEKRQKIKGRKRKLTMADIPKGVGLDIGTSFLVAGRFNEEGEVSFKSFRDAFFLLEPKTAINKQMIKKGLETRNAVYIEKDGKFYVLGEDAFLMANERHENTRRPLSQGVVSPKEKEALPILKEIIARLLGKPRTKNEVVVFSVPGKPIDAEFDQVFHQNVLKQIVSDLGYSAQPMNEAEAVAYSELLDNDLTGIAMSWGAGMVNVAVLSSGDPVVSFSTSKSGDYIDHSVAVATNMTDSIVQQEKEGGVDLMKPGDSLIAQAIAVYYGNLMVYTLEQVAYELRKSPKLPKFKNPIPLVVAGGTSLPAGFIEKFKQALGAVDMPVQISEVRHATDPLTAVANGLTLAASMVE